MCVSDTGAVEYCHSRIDDVCVHEQCHQPHTVATWSFALGSCSVCSAIDIGMPKLMCHTLLYEILLMQHIRKLKLLILNYSQLQIGMFYEGTFN